MSHSKAVIRLRDNVLCGYAIFCPGCKHAHMFPVDKKYYEGSSIYGPDHKKPIWAFSGSLDAPTFSPSLRCFFTHPETKQEITTCHMVVTNGMIQFCGDCQHELKNQTVPVPDFPSNYSL
jgi:hypothetical protein